MSTKQLLVIAIDARAAAEVPAGRGRYVRELLRGLARNGDPGLRFELWARSEWRDELVDADPRFRWRLVSAPDPLWHLVVAVRAGGDVFLSTNSYLTAWATRIPTVITVYDLVAFEEPQHVQPRAGRIERATIRPALRRAAAFVCISESTERDLLRWFPRARGRTYVTPLAANGRLAVGGSGEPEATEDPYVLAVGTIEPRKNLAGLLEAWTSLPSDLREAHRLVLVGPRGWDDAPILDAAREAGAEMTGRVPDEVLASLYRGAHLFVYPSFSEGFGLPVLEAMTMGAPVVTSSVSAMPEVAGHAAILVDPRDVPGLASAIEKVLGDADLRVEMRQRGHERASHYSWDRTTEDTLRVLRSVAARSG